MASIVGPFPYARYTEEVWNSHNPDALAEYFAPDARVHSMTPGVVAGTCLDYLKGRAQSLLNAFPDVHYFAMYRIVDGKITDVWSLIDMQALRDQLQGGPSSTGHFR